MNQNGFRAGLDALREAVDILGGERKRDRATIHTRMVIRRSICAAAKEVRNLRISQERSLGREDLREKLAEGDKLAQSLRKIISNKHVKTLILETGTGREHQFDDMERELNRISLLFNRTIDNAMLAGRRGSVGSWVGYQLPARTSAVIYAQYLFQAVRNGQKPRYQEDFEHFIIHLWTLSGGGHVEGWRRQIDNANAKNVVEGTEGVHIASRLAADDLASTLARKLNAIRSK